jgi:hypothetical protein
MVGLAMQEPQYGEPSIRNLMHRIAAPACPASPS